MDSLVLKLQRRDVILRAILLAATLLLGLILANMAASLFQVWKLDTGGLIPGPWNGILDSARATRRTDLLSLLGVALLGGAGLACLVFFLERIVKSGWSWLQDALRK